MAKLESLPTRVLRKVAVTIPFGEKLRTLNLGVIGAARVVYACTARALKYQGGRPFSTTTTSQQTRYLIIIDRGISQEPHSAKAVRKSKLLAVIRTGSYRRHTSIHKGSLVGRSKYM